MQRYKILHRTYYNFSDSVILGPHYLRLRPHENHELRIESSTLNITPSATLLWHRDVEGNSVAIAAFDLPTTQLIVESEMFIHQFNENPLDFVVESYAVDYPFRYQADDEVVLLPYMEVPQGEEKELILNWLQSFIKSDEQIQSYTLLHRLSLHINQTLSYKLREEPGVQTAGQTLSYGTGSCRDFATLFMQAARCLGLAARFVSGYNYAEPSAVNFGSTHAWAEVYLPGAGWKGFDPTNGEIVGSEHFAVAVARLPESVPPIAGSFVGPSGSQLDVGVWVTKA